MRTVTFLLWAACFAGCGAERPQVVANGEQLAGEWADDAKSVAAFKGIPFAAAPLGDRRWRAPRPHAPREGVQSATSFAPACMQDDIIVDWYAEVAAAFGQSPDVVERPHGVSEDCLYLNVWTNALRAQALQPVMVWIHGGSNEGGWAYEPNYVGTNLARRGVVVVSIAYRLGAFGFFAHPALESEDGEPVANFGWLDQFAALEWIRDNVAAFGGDPENVTVFGESAGAGDLLNMIGADRARGLVQRFIAQSHATDLAGRARLGDEQGKGMRIAAALGIANDAGALTRLRAVPASELLAAAKTALPDHYYDIVVDRRTLEQTPLAWLAEQSRVDVDLLAGVNADEWTMYLEEDTDWPDVDAWLEQHQPGTAARLRELVSGEPTARRALDRLRTAYDMTCSLRRAAISITTKGGRAFLYEFTRARQGPGGDALGAYHGTEIPYVFDTHDAWLPTNAADRRLTGAVMDFWVQFARTGDPNIDGRKHWPQYRVEDRRTMLLDEPLEVRKDDDTLCVAMAVQDAAGIAP